MSPSGLLKQRVGSIKHRPIVVEPALLINRLVRGDPITA